MKRLRWSMAIILSSPALATAAHGQVAIRRFPSFKLWITESGDQFCKLGGEYYIKKLYPTVARQSLPSFIYHIDGKPSGPSLIVEVEGLTISPERCYWRISSRVVAYEKPGYQVEDKVTEFYNLGPTRVFGSLQANDVSEKIEAQMSFLATLWSDNRLN